MTAFKSYRRTHEYTQTNSAPPEKVFPLLCPVREADWAPGWQYRMIYSESGVAELGCIFATPNSQGGGEKTWIIVEYDPVAFRVAFVWIEPGRIATEIRIQLTPVGPAETRARIRYRYTGLSPDGNREVERHDRNWFVAMMEEWQSAFNHYLRTGRAIHSSPAE